MCACVCVYSTLTFYLLICGLNICNYDDAVYEKKTFFSLIKISSDISLICLLMDCLSASKVADFSALKTADLSELITRLDYLLVMMRFIL